MKAILLAAISAIGLGAGAQAATIDVGPGTVSCFLSGTATGADCQGIVSGPPTIYSSTSATIYGIGANSEANEAAFLNGLLGALTYGKNDVDKTDKGGANSATYTVDSLYFLIKIGAGHAFFLNNSGQDIDVTYQKKSGPAGAQGGLSHESQIGALPPVNVVPLPAGLPLLLAGVGAFAVLRRRKAA